MYNIIGKNVWDVKDNQTTPEHIFKSRRQALQNLAGGSIALAGLASFPSSVFGNANSFYPPVSNTLYKVNREITEEKLATTYTNFYEFGSSKNIWRRAALLKTKPWMLTIDGLVKKPVTIDVSDLLKTIEITFNITPWLFLVPITVIVLILLKTKPLLALTSGIILAAIFSFIFQPNVLGNIGSSKISSVFTAILTDIQIHGY